MSTLESKKLAYGNATLCHVCHKPVEAEDFGIEHMGHVGMRNQLFSAEGDGSIILHAECATVLAMRLIHDAMDQRERTIQTPLRAVEVLGRNRSKSK